MRRWTLCWAAFSSLALFAGDALAQETFVEGHVFNFRSGRPIANASIEVSVGCAICAVVPTVVGYDVTDANGFYEVKVGPLRDVAFDYDTVNVRVSCRNSEALYTGYANAKLRNETLRRDVYLKSPVDLIRCAPYQR